MKKIVIFTPSKYSLYTLSVLQLLLNEPVEVRAVCIRRLFNKKRFMFELQRDGKRLLKKVWQKLVLRKSAYKAATDYETIVDLIKKLNIKAGSVDKLCQQNKIPSIFCNSNI